MEFSAHTRAWLLLIMIMLGSGCGVVVTAYMGGSKLWVAILTGVGAAATNVVTALMKSPSEAKREDTARAAAADPQPHDHGQV